MAKSKNNVITYGLSGKIGDLLVFRQKNGQTIVANKSRERSVPLSEKQAAIVALFKKAAVYAKGIVSNALRQAPYLLRKKKGQSLYVQAVTDYLTSPVLADADISGYQGNPGDIVSVSALDDLMVTAVKVSMRDAADVFIEGGDAIQDPDNDVQWNYSIQQENPSIAGTKISFTAYDLPGNSTILSETVS